MRVRLTTQISGTRNGQEWPPPGHTVDLPDFEAKALISNGSAVEPGEDRGTVMVPPAGVHTPGSVLRSDLAQPFVEAPADAVADPDGTKQAMKDASEGRGREVPIGVGVQHRDGHALTPEELTKSEQREKETREALGAEAPKVGEKVSTTPKQPAK